MATNFWGTTERAESLWAKAITAQNTAAQELNSVENGKIAAAAGTGDTQGMREVKDAMLAAARYTMPDGFSTPTKAKWSE